MSPPVIDDPTPDDAARVESAMRRARIRADLTAVWLQAILEAAPPDSEAVCLIRGSMVVPLFCRFGDRIKTADELRFMQPRRQR